MSVSTKALGCTIFIACLSGRGALGQQSMDFQTVDQEIEDGVFDHSAFASPPHVVLEAPKPRRHGQAGSFEGEVVRESAHGSSAGAPKGKGTLPHEKVAEHFLHADKTPRAVAIPGASRAPVWKTPYSYGHFGASRNRQWTLHHGYREAYTQWTLR